MQIYFSAVQMTDPPLVERFEALCAEGNIPPDVFAFLRQHGGAAAADKAAICAIDILRRWRSDTGIPVERYFEQLPDVGADERLKLRLIACEYRCRRALGQAPSLDAWRERFPQMSETELASLSAEGEPRQGDPGMDPTKLYNGTIRTDGAAALSVPLDAAPTASRPSAASADRIGRYRIQRILGDGGFGRVFLAFDDELHRSVAIKVPHQSRVSAPEDIDAYLNEARILARLDHPVIVPIFDFGRTDDGRCFAVSKYIEGSDLATKIRGAQLTYSASAELLAIVAEGLHYAHLRGIVHRDIKPANILIDKSDQPYIADFGIALKEEDYGKDGPTVGTPAYMSPEQFRGEGHLVDGRSDVYSLGLVLYELLTGRRLFGRTRADREKAAEPRPPRQIDDSVPRELERICLKALAARVSERYSTANDMAADLRHYIDHDDPASRHIVPAPALSGISGTRSGESRSLSNPPTIRPKGLRSFDREDAEFFLELLPGPRDRTGLPESVRFWVSRLSEADPESTFRVGLLYGPSGCGKSSFLKAGVIPRLPENVVAVYVEATPAETEARLLKALRRSCPSIPPDLDLSETVAALRRGRDLRAGTKVLIVLDQFEQWLHARRKEESSELIRALRQCDGIHVQCIVSVRDDFWMAVTHFMGELEVALVPDRNIAAVDLFRLSHARRILTALGRAYDALPAGHEELSAAQKSFVESAVKDLASNELVIPVHLALFAEMVKEKPWVPATLKEVGGAEGVGVTFLEETFNGRTANPNHRLHQKGARAVLQALLSDMSGSIKGGMRSYEELLHASGYEGKRNDFDALLRILDTELRLITPTDPEGVDADAPPQSHAMSAQERYFHLTHDYLVPALHEWLARKQMETRRGRAELVLAERAALWNARPSKRHLPSLAEWLRIMALADGGRIARQPEERRMMRAANRYHTARVTLAVALLAVAGWWFHDSEGRSRGRSLVDSLASAAVQDVPALIRQMEPVRRWTDRRLAELSAAAEPGSRQELHVRLALLPVDRGEQDFLVERALAAEPETLLVIRSCVARYGDADAAAAAMWNVLSDENSESERRIRAAVALAELAPGKLESDPRWGRVAALIAKELVKQVASHPDQFAAWTGGLSPVRTSLDEPLAAIFSSSAQRESEREFAAAILAEYAADRPDSLVDLILVATPQQHRTLLPRLKASSPETTAKLREKFAQLPATEAGPDESSTITRSRAHAAVTLFELGIPEPLWEALGTPDDPELDAVAEDRLAALGSDPEGLYRKLVGASPTPLRAALLRSLASQNPEELRPGLRDECLHAFESAFRDDPDSGVHSAAEWGLRRWKMIERLDSITRAIASEAPRAQRNWYVTRNGHTLALFRGPVVCKTGSPEKEAGRDASDEGICTHRIARDFAVATTEVTIRQFQDYIPDFRHRENAYAQSPDCPASGMTWYRAAEYCLALSKAEGIPEEQYCYRPIGSNQFEELPDCLGRTGYRLPTEAEWEFTCRAGSDGPYSWGSDPALSRRFAWSIETSNARHWPVGSLCPNRYGMFDMQGNVAEWMIDYYRDKLPDFEEDSEIRDLERDPFRPDIDRVHRGGSAADNVRYLRSANRRKAGARTIVSFQTGFRVARTLRVVDER